MKIATKRKIEIIVLILIVCMVSLGACGKGEEDYKKEIATLAEEQGLEDVEVSLELDVVIKASEKSVIVSDEECFLEQMFRHAIKWNRTVYLQMVHIAVLV